MLSSPARAGSTRHEAAALEVLAHRLATIKGYEFGGEFSAQGNGAGLYFVPDDTLLAEDARALGIRDEDDFFGGVVPHAFIATKTITHPLVAPDAAAPRGWVADFALAVADVVLPGYSVFSRQDARRAALDLLRLGGVRYKPARKAGGQGQRSIAAIDDLDACFSDDADLDRHGGVVELELEELATYSIGQVHLAGMLISYYGTQRRTLNYFGQSVYGGSDLTVRRGPLRAWLQGDLPPALRTAIEEACHYDRMVSAAYPGFFASRRNYDVLQGIGANGRRYSGVLEQSWRCGGATPAEIAAIEVLRADDALQVVHAESREIYAEVKPPPDATVYFHGEDPRDGAMVKYGRVRQHGYSP